MTPLSDTIIFCQIIYKNFFERSPCLYSSNFTINSLKCSHNYFQSVQSDNVIHFITLTQRLSLKVLTGLMSPHQPFTFFRSQSLRLLFDSNFSDSWPKFNFYNHVSQNNVSFSMSLTMITAHFFFSRSL